MSLSLIIALSGIAFSFSMKATWSQVALKCLSLAAYSNTIRTDSVPREHLWLHNLKCKSKAGRVLSEFFTELCRNHHETYMKYVFIISLPNWLWHTSLSLHGSDTYVKTLKTWPCCFVQKCPEMSRNVQKIMRNRIGQNLSAARCSSPITWWSKSQVQNWWSVHFHP